MKRTWICVPAASHSQFTVTLPLPSLCLAWRSFSGQVASVLYV